MAHLRSLALSLALSPALLACSSASSAPGKSAPTTATPTVHPTGPVIPVEIAAAGVSFCARMSDGTVRCWGQNDALQLGDGTFDDSSRPRPVLGVAGAVRIAAGLQSTCALGRDTSLRCWGCPSIWSDRMPVPARLAMKLGDGIDELGFMDGSVCYHVVGRNGHTCVQPKNAPDGLKVLWQADPVQPSPYLKRTGSSQVREWTASGEYDYTQCGIGEQGKVLCRGQNLYAALGNGSDDGLVDTFAPAVGLVDVVQVVPGCALRRDGTVACWGSNSYGELGFPADPQLCTNHNSCTRVPTTVPGLHDVVEIVHKDTLCARLSNGEVHCILRMQDSLLKKAELRRVDLPARAVQLVAGFGTRCVLTDTHEVYCWGKDDHGQTGRGRILETDRPVQVPDLRGVVHVEASLSGTALLESGAVRNWGSQWGLLFDDETRRSDVSVADATAVAGPCALRKDGTVWCWGDNWSGQMGIGRYFRKEGEDPSVAKQVPGVRDVKQIVSDGGSAVCALRKDGSVLCWGENMHASLPSGPDIGAMLSPMRLTGTPPFTEIAMGYGLTADGAVWSWQMSDREWGKKKAPVRLTDVPPVAHLAKHAPLIGSRRGAGGEGCFVLTDGTVHCRGPNPKVEGLTDIVEIAANARPAGCALRKDGLLRCWTYPEGTPGARDVLTEMLPDAREITGAAHGFCAVRKDGTVWCWGKNDTGIIGPASAPKNAPPARVVDL